MTMDYGDGGYHNRGRGYSRGGWVMVEAVDSEVVAEVVMVADPITSKMMLVATMMKYVFLPRMDVCLG